MAITHDNPVDPARPEHKAWCSAAAASRFELPLATSTSFSRSVSMPALGLRTDAGRGGPDSPHQLIWQGVFHEVADRSDAS